MVSEQLLLALGFLAICIFAVKAPHFFASKTPVMRAAAEVISRKGELPTATLPTQWGGRLNYQVTFSIEGESKVLHVDASQFARLVEGTTGMLTWRDDTLVDFVPESKEEV